MVLALSVILTFESSEDYENAIPVLIAHRDRCLADEPGTLFFELLKGNVSDTELLLYKKYENPDALEAHLDGESFKVGGKELEDMGIKFSMNGMRATTID